jgi:hypothetical protein
MNDDMLETESKGIEMMEAALEEFGLVREEKRPSGNGRAREDSDSPYNRLNDHAMKNLLLWVMDLGIYKLHRQRGRYESYVGVAQWRRSTTHGDDIDKRDLNLKITQLGIKDFGDNRKYTPLNLVMAAKGCDLNTAFDWLAEKTGFSLDAPEIDIEAIRAKQAEDVAQEGVKPDLTGNGSAEREPEARTPIMGPDGRERIQPGKLLGDAWYFGDPVPEQAPMLVPFFVPARGFGYLGGQWGTFKTFILNDLAVAVASGGRFAGQQVSGPGVVIQIELEGSNNEARMLASATARQCENQRLPIVHLKKEPPKILVNARPNPAFREWAQQLAEFASAVAAQFDLPLALITIDPQGKVAGFRDEQSSSEGQVVSDAFEGLSKRAGCALLVADHFGKDPTAGLRGTSAKETNPLFILNTSDQQRDTHAQRYLEIRKMRNGVQGMLVDFWMRDEEVSTQQIVRGEDGATVTETVTIKTLAIRWGEELRPAADHKGAKERKKSISELALAALSDLISKSGVPLPAGCAAPEGLRGALEEAWRLELVTGGVIAGAGKPGTAFGNVKRGLLAAEKIEVGNGFVWLPLLS